MINFQKVTKIYQSNYIPIIALADVSFQIEKKEFVSIAGKSGSGKTTLLKLLLAEERPDSGQIFFENYEINKLSFKKLPIHRRKIGTIFQDYKLISSKTIYENIAYIMEVMGVNDNDIAENVFDILKIVGLKERAESFPIELSGGERQRVAIARALIHRPDIILADEPTGNLDLYHSLDIIQLLLKINEMGTTIILATHNKEIINSLTKRVITLDGGKVIRDEKEGRFIL
jgi:cell division transport system ATP-binding protein